MIGVYVTVPAACFRKGLAREYLETEIIPPPSTCYGFLLSLVGETDRRKHIGVRVTPMLFGEPDTSVVLRTVWRVKKQPLGSPGNTRPDYQQILTGLELIIWLDSRDDCNQDHSLEKRVQDALHPQKRGTIHRFGGLSLGESTHLVDQVALYQANVITDFPPSKIRPSKWNDQGRLGLPVWVDHVGSANTVHVIGDLVDLEQITEPAWNEMPQITSSRERS